MKASPAPHVQQDDITYTQDIEMKSHLFNNLFFYLSI